MAYFDNNATTPLFSEVRNAISDSMDSCWANPSSPHRKGLHARACVERARKGIAASLGVNPKFLTFCSGATEANNALVANLASCNQRKGKALVSEIEHPSILESVARSFGKRAEFFSANSEGRVELDEVKDRIERQRPTFVSMIAAHNETGVLQPWREVSEICRGLDIWFHCDATQWIGKLEYDGIELCSSFSFSAHKFGGPKGMGVLVSKKPASWIRGGSQEMDARGGTENLHGIIGLEAAWSMLETFSSSDRTRESWKRKFEEKMAHQFPSIRVVGHKLPRLWNTSLLILPEFQNLCWISKLDKLGYSLSTGSACSSGKHGGSALAKAIGLSLSESSRLVRVSSYWHTTEENWEGLAGAFSLACQELRNDHERNGVISL